MAKNVTGAAVANMGEFEKHQNTYGPADSESNEFSIGELVRFVYSALPHMLTGAIILGGLAFAYLLVQRIAVPPVSTYRTALIVTMNNATPGKYPNGADFALTDLRSPVVLDEVYRANKLADYHVSLAGFSDMVGIETFSPAYDSLTTRYHARLDNKTLTFEERKAIEDEFKQALDALKSKGILVTLSVPEASKMPDMVAQKIVNDIPAKWATVFIDRLGVANMPVPVSGEDVVDTKLIKELDYPLVYDYLVKQAETIGQQLALINDIPGSSSFVSSSSGKSIADLRRELDSVDQFRLRLGLKPIVDQGLSREAAVTSLIYANLIGSLDKDAAQQVEYSKRVSSVLYDFRANKDTQQSASGAASPGGSSTSGAQFDGAFIDKIIGLSKQGAGLEFEQDLLKKKLAFENAGVDFADRKSRLFERIQSMNRGDLVGDVQIALEKKFVAGMDRTVADLNRLWTESNGFMNDLNNKRLNFDKSLYQLNELPSSMKMEKSGLLTTRALVIFMAAVVFGLLAGLGYFFLRRMSVAR
jgi:hypothetical protein